MKADRHGGGTSPSLPTCGTANRVRTGVRNHHASKTFIKLQDNQQNSP